MKTFTHGLFYGYNVKKCRCDLCMDAMRRKRARLLTKGADGINRAHGYSSYINFGCRCEVCRKGNSEFNLGARARRAQRGVPDDKHGTLSGYLNYACRCDECKSARATYQRALYARKTVHREVAAQTGESE